jgi:hypothetical protein
VCVACRRDTDPVPLVSSEGRIVNQLCADCLATIHQLQLESTARLLAQDEADAIAREMVRENGLPETRKRLTQRRANRKRRANT